jgi:SpoVK/Ycf46/Vps4 family AAA+-type ATPase
VRRRHSRTARGAASRRAPALEALAQRIEPRANLDDLVLPRPVEELLARIAEQVRRRAVVGDRWTFGRRPGRGAGISMSFVGGSDGARALAAESFARRVGLALHRVDLSAVASKYIGETEKNLRRLFDAAEDGDAILFFDEADALFGKRTDVRDSHDRYAGIEAGYLLQQLEEHRGVTIFAACRERALDRAFVRRLRFVVRFP